MPSQLDKIDHIVVLMMENRSFDAMLGWLYDPANPPPYDRAPRGQSFEGLSGKNLANPIPPYAPEAERGSVPAGRATGINTPNPDPGEDYAHVNVQLFNRVIPPANRFPPFNHPPYNLPLPLPEPAPMNGFVTLCEHLCEGAPARAHLCGIQSDHGLLHAGPGAGPERPRTELSRMRSLFRRGAKPDLSQSRLCACCHLKWACRQFALCELVVHACPTIYNRIQEASRPALTWKVYYDELNLVSITWLLQPALRPYRLTNCFHIDEFFKDEREGTLPSYSFIEPRLIINHNDQHPPMDDFLFTKRMSSLFS
jgi:phospholipase C